MTKQRLAAKPRPFGFVCVDGCAQGMARLAKMARNFLGLSADETLGDHAIMTLQLTAPDNAGMLNLQFDDCGNVEQIVAWGEVLIGQMLKVRHEAELVWVDGPYTVFSYFYNGQALSGFLPDVVEKWRRLLGVAAWEGQYFQCLPDRPWADHFSRRRP
jgi:hypothetical protein